MRAAAIVFILLLAAAPALAQAPAARYVGRPVSDVEVLIENTPATEDVLERLIEVRPGEPLSMHAIRESIAHLYSLRRFQDIRVDASDAASGGVSVRFTLIPVHVVEEIEFTGNLALSAGLLRDTIRDRFGPAPPVGRAEEAARTLMRLYQDEGYLSANVRPEAEERHDPDRTVLRFHVEPGPRALIREASVEGAPVLTSPAGLLRRIDATRGSPYRASRIQERLDEFRNDLRKRGYYEATASILPTPSGGNTVDLLITVMSGPMVTVRFEGDPLAEDRRDELVAIRREASLDEDLLEDAETNIEQYLRSQGYWKADVSVRQDEGDGTLAVIFTVERGPLYRVADAVEIRGAQALPVSDLRAQVKGLQPGEVYRDAELTATAAAIGAFYRVRGFAAVEVKPAANEIDPVRPGEGLIQPVVVLTEGPRVLVEAVEFGGNAALADEHLRSLVTSGAGAPYYQPQVVADRDRIIVDYLNRGYATATVDVQAAGLDDGAGVTLRFVIDEGPQTIVDHILIVGNMKTAPAVILRELQFKEGGPLGAEARFDSHRRLTQLGLFRRVRIDDVSHGGGRTDVVVTVEEAPRTSIGYGGGVEFRQRLRGTGPSGEAREDYEFRPRGFFDIGRRNLWGRNRSVNLYTRISFGPKDAPNDPSIDGTGFDVSEYRLVGTYREPRWFGANDLNVTGAVEQGERSSFNFTRQGLNAEIFRTLTPFVRVSGRYSFSTTRIFDARLEDEEQQQIDRAFPQVRLSGFSGAILRDSRDDVLDPERGMFLSMEATVAARALGGQVGFMKTYMQGSWFRRLPGPRRVVFATRAAVGLADGFERETPVLDPDGNPVPGETQTVEDLPASERFFAGGDTTIRGFALDSVGAPDTISSLGFPTGGNAVLILNAELRAPVWGDVGAAVFVDGGNVFRRVTQFDPGELRGSVGFGLRYNSPIGPVRVDLGFKLDRREIAGNPERRTALHFSIGQAF